MKTSIKRAAGSALEPLKKAVGILTDGADSSLYAYTVLRGARASLEEAEETIKPEANAEFNVLIDAEPLRKEFVVLNEGGLKIATAVRYTPRTMWQYSQATEKLANELKAAQVREQTNGTAKKLASTSDTLFSLKLA